jgi:competence protein ComEA
MLLARLPEPVQSEDRFGAPIDINQATVEQLARLRGIGPSRAALIVRIRERNGPFRSVEELRVLPRLSEKQFAAIRPLVIVKDGAAR